MKSTINSLLLSLMTFIGACYIQGCISPNAGTGTDTSTKIVAMGVVVNDKGDPIKGALVEVYPVDFNPTTDTIAPFCKDTSDTNGEFFIRTNNLGTFNVLARNESDSTSGIALNIKLNTPNTQIAAPVTMKKRGVLSIALSVMHTSQGGALFIPGTPFFQTIGSERNVCLNNLPEGTYPTIFYTQNPSNSNRITAITDHGTKITSSDSSFIFSVLLVTGCPELPTYYEYLLIKKMEAIGGNVTLMNDDSLEEGRCSTASVIVISASCVSEKIGSFFTKIRVPILVSEANLFDDMGFTGSEFKTDFGVIDSQTYIKIVSSDHPISRDVSGKTISTLNSPSESIYWGHPEGEVSIIATCKNDSTMVALFCYERNAMMKNIAAPERRIGFFMKNSSDFTKDGLSLFNNSIFWLLGKM